MWINEDTWINELFAGDNLKILEMLPAESVDLIYIDPPFYSNKGWEIIWKNGLERNSFDDRWEGGIKHYIRWMKKRLQALKRVLKPTGSIFIHLDWHACHYIKCELDKIFGYDSFRNEIVWCYTGASSPGQRQFPRKHDVIYWYSKGNQWTFNGEDIRIPYSEATRKRAAAGEKGGKSAESIFHGKRTKRTLYTGGKLPEDWWLISPVGSTAKERIGYPTQKPVALLERIIKAASNEGDIILDAFCGGGTTMDVAEKLNRRWIGIDVSPRAINVCDRRLKKICEEDYLIYGLPARTERVLKKMSGGDFQDWVIRQINGKPSPKKVHDFGIDGYTAEGLPVQVKKSEGVGRPEIDKFKSALEREDVTSGKIFAMSFTRGAKEETSRLEIEKGFDIELVNVKEYLLEKYKDYSEHL